MAFGQRPTTTFGTRTAFGTSAAGTTGGGFQRAGTGFGQQTPNTGTFAQAGVSRFGQGTAAPTGFGQSRPTTGFGQGSQLGGQATGFGGQQGMQQQQQSGAPNYHPTQYSEVVNNSETKGELRAITGMDAYKEYTFEQLRWLNMIDPTSIPAQQAAGTGFGQRATTGGFGQQAQPATGGFGQRTGGFGQQAAQPTATTGGFGQQRTGFGATAQQPAATGGFGQQRTGFGQQQATATTGFGSQRPATGFGAQAKPTGFGQQQTATTGFGGAGTGFAQQQPVFQQQQGTGFAAQKTGFGAGATSGFGNNGLRAATGVNRDGTTGATGLARPGFGTGAAPTGFGQQPAATGFGAGAAGGFQRPAYGAPQQAVNEPVYYTSISTAPFGILPQILKDTAAPKQPTEAPKAATAPATMSASKRKHAMLPHYKLTPRSESASARTTRSLGADPEATGRDMFVSKMGGVKKLVIEPTDTEQSALFNPAERARLRAGIATGSSSVMTSPASIGTYPSTPSAHGHAAASAFTSPNIYATPSFPRGAAGIVSTLNGSDSAAGHPMSIVASPAPGGFAMVGGPTGLLATNPAGVLPGANVTVNSLAPKLTIPGCFTIPSISDLRLKSAAELSRLPEFSIGHSMYGMVTWKTPTDVRNLNLDQLVSFSQDCVDVYPESNFPQGSPADGVLNKPATVTIYQVSVHRLLGREGKSPARHQQQALSNSELDQVIAELQRITSAFQGRFVSFVPDGHKWTFEVDHFTRYGLNGSNAVNPPTNAASTAQSSPNHSPTRRGRGGISYSRAPSAGKTNNPLPSSNAPSAFKTLHIENDDDSDDSESAESVQPLLPSRSDVRPKRSASSGSSNAPASLVSAEDDDAGYEDDDEDDSTSAAPLSHRSLEQDDQFDQTTEVHSNVDDLSLSGGDEEDEEEDYGDDDSHFYDSDFSRSDSASAHPQGGRSQQTRQMGRGAWEGNAMDETSSHRSFASSRSRTSHTRKSAHPNSHDRASNAVDDIGRDGSESRHSRLFPHSTTHGPFDALSNARSPHLARQLGLNARHMQQMKADFFPGSSAPTAAHRPLPAPNFSTAKRQELFDEALSPANAPMSFRSTTSSFTPGWDSHAAKRFKSSNPTLSEVKMQAPVSGGQMMRVMRIPPPISQPAPPSPATSARLIAPLAKVSESIIKPVPLSNSVTKNASELFVDPMLFFGRSSRVCWSPDGSTMFCPKFTTIEKKKLFVAPTSVSESLVPSVLAHSRLSVFPHNRKTNALPSLTLGDNWNSFVNHQLAIVATQRQECQNLIGEADSGSGVNGKSKSLLNEAYLKLDTELNAWKMFKTLFGDVQAQFAEIVNRFATPNTIDHVKELVRKHQLDALLCEMTIDQVKADLVEVSKRFASTTATSVASGELQWKVLFYLLSGKCIKEAVDLALEMGEHRLALLLTQLADSTNLTSDMKSQLQSWSKEGLMGPNNVDNYKLEIYSILAGEIRVVASEHRISDWIRSFALFFWYSGPNPFSQPLKSTIDLYTSLITSPKSAISDSESQKSDSLSLRPPQPLPGYARHLPSLKTVHYDIIYHLLSMYGESDYPLDDLLHPLSSSPRILDHALAWHLLTVCEAANLGDAPTQVSTEITLNFATQLEALGLWQIAYYVLLALPASSQGESLRNHAVKQLLFRHVSSLQGVLTGEASSLRIDDELLARVLDFSSTRPAYLQATHLQNIHPWIYEALALWFGSKGDFVQQFFMLLAHCQYTDAHNVLLNKWAPKIILDIGVTDTSAWPKNFVDGLVQLEAASADHIINWTYGGNIFLSFYRWQNEVHSALKSWQTNSNDLVDLSLLAQLNLDSSSFMALANEYTSALQGLYKLLQDTEAENTRTELDTNAIKTSWSNIPELQGPAGLSMKQREGMTATSVKTELVCASELVSQLTASIASLKTLIACIDSDAAFPSAIAAHTVPLSSLETLDSLEPLAHSFLPPDDLSANLSLLTSRYLDWRVSAI